VSRIRRPGAGRRRSRFFVGIAGWAVNDFRVLDVVGTGRRVVAQAAVDFTLAFTLAERPTARRRGAASVDVRRGGPGGGVRHYCATAKHVAATRN
jgi:hypothetical protein